MDKLKAIIKEYEDYKKEATIKYETELRKYLKDCGLKGDVIRNEDGRLGVLIVHYESYSPFAKVGFYPYTKSGAVSKNKSGFVWLGDLTKKFRKA